MSRWRRVHRFLMISIVVERSLSFQSQFSRERINSIADTLLFPLFLCRIYIMRCGFFCLPLHFPRKLPPNRKRKKVYYTAMFRCVRVCKTPSSRSVHKHSLNSIVLFTVGRTLYRTWLYKMYFFNFIKQHQMWSFSFLSRREADDNEKQ